MAINKPCVLTRESCSPSWCSRQEEHTTVVWCRIGVNYHRFLSLNNSTNPPLPRVGSQAPPPVMTTPAAHNKLLTTNSINFSGLEYLLMLVVPQSAVFCLGLNTRQELLQSSGGRRPVKAPIERTASECRWGGLLGSGHKQRRPLCSKRVTFQSWYGSTTGAWTNFSSCTQLRLQRFMLLRLKPLNQTECWQGN